MCDSSTNIEEVVGEVVEQRPGRLPGCAAGEVPRVVLDARAVPGLAQHLEVVVGALPQPLRLEQLAAPSSSSCSRSLELDLDVLDRLLAASRAA